MLVVAAELDLEVLEVGSSNILEHVLAVLSVVEKCPTLTRRR